MKDIDTNFTHRTSRTTKLIRVVEMNVDAGTPTYKIKLKKNGKLKVKLKNLHFNLTCKLIVENNSGIRVGETWNSNGINYRVTEVLANGATLINCGISMNSFRYPDVFLYIATPIGESSQI